MTAPHMEKPAAVGVSISDSPDLRVFGLSDGHLRDAMAETALEVLASGWSLAYGGDLRKHGFSELLAEFVGRYRGHPQHGGAVDVTDYLAWPVHIRLTPEALAALAEFEAQHEPAVRFVFLRLDGTRLRREERQVLQVREPDEDEWTGGLTAMRRVMRGDIRARILLGGRVEGYRGAIPGIAEEAWLSLETRQPVFLLGGFGGCTRDIAETIGLVDPWAGSRGEWAGRARFREYTADALRNGLSLEENAVLACTPHIEEAVALVSRGLRCVGSGSLLTEATPALGPGSPKEGDVAVPSSHHVAALGHAVAVGIAGGDDIARWRAASAPIGGRFPRRPEPLPERDSTALRYWLLGEEQSAGNAKAAYVAVFAALAERDTDFLARVAPKLRGRRNRGVGRTKWELSSNESIANSGVPLPGNWWLLTKLPNDRKIRSLRIACDAAGIRFGDREGLDISLPNA